MSGSATIDGGRAAAELLAWWLESGVDTPVGEAARDWRAPRTAVAPSAPAPQSLPDDLAAFREWLAKATDLPLASAAATRALPLGQEGAEVMLLTDNPSPDAPGDPLGGAAGELARRMLAAIGIAPDAAYLANLSCLSGPGLRLSADELRRCADIARRHVALAKPRRLLLLGDGPARALLGGGVAQRRGKVHKVEGVRTVATFAPAFLLTSPAQKALAWRDLLLLMED